MTTNNTITVPEYCELFGYSGRSGYVSRRLRAGKLLMGMKSAKKVKGIWLIEI